MEQKLKELRHRQRKENLWNILTLKNLRQRFINTKMTSVPPTPELEKLATPVTDSFSVQSDDESTMSDVYNNSSNPVISHLNWATWILYFLLWITCLLITIQLEFAAVYIVCSGLIFIYLNTRTRAKKPGEISAYSVFNPNCEAIDGTLKAEQFEREFNLIHHSPPIIK